MDARRALHADHPERQRQIGCAKAERGDNDLLVCEYSPQGNSFDEKVY